MIGTAELIVFAIQAATRLARTGRMIYLEESIRRELPFPLPASLGNLATTAESYGQSLSAYPEGTRQRQAYDALFAPAIHAGDTDGIIAAYLDRVHRGLVPQSKITAREMAGLAQLPQWEDADVPFPKPLQRVAGTLVNIAVDYFVHVPGALADDTKQGKVLKTLLRGLDDVAFDEARWDSMVIALFTAGLEAFNAHPDLFSGEDERRDGERIDTVVRTAVSGIAGDLAKRMQHLEGPDVFDAEDRLRQFGAIVFRSVIGGASRSVVENPEVLGVKGKDERALVVGVGSAFLDLLLGVDGGGDDELPRGLMEGLRRVASTDGLDALMKAALRVAAEHPDLIGSERRPVTKWLRDVVTGLYELYPERENLFDPELLANIAYLVLEHGIADLNGLVLKNVAPGSKALAVEAAGRVLAVLAQPPSGNQPARWDFDLSRSDLAAVASGVLGSLAAHPEWLLAKRTHRKIAASALPLAVEVLTQLGGGSEAAWFKGLLRSGRLESVLAAVLSSGVLEALKDEQGAYPAAGLIAKSFTRVLSRVLDQGRSGMDAVLAYDTLHDLLTAVTKSGVLAALFPEHTTDAKRVVDELIKIINAQRGNEIVPATEMAKRLKDAKETRA